MSPDDERSRRTVLRSVTTGVALGVGGFTASTSAAAEPETFSLSELEARDDVHLRDLETEADCEQRMACLEKFCEPGYTYGQILECCGDECEVVESGCLCHA